MNGTAAGADAIFREMTAYIVPPRAFVACRHGGEIASVAYGVVHRELLVIESVATAPHARGKGLARRVVEGLMSWGSTLGAGGACLQVLAENTPALAVYTALGFDRELYRYHYRR